MGLLGLGSSRDHLGSVLAGSWSHVGVLLEVRRHLGSVLEVIIASVANPSKPLEDIAKMKVPRSRN